MHSLDCDEINKVEQSWTKLNKVEQSWTKLNKVEQSLRHCYRVISENLVKFDKQIAENIKLLLSVCEFVSLWVSEWVSLWVSEIWSYWAAYAAKKIHKIP